MGIICRYSWFTMKPKLSSASISITRIISKERVKNTLDESQIFLFMASNHYFPKQSFYRWLRFRKSHFQFSNILRKKKKKKHHAQALQRTLKNLNLPNSMQITQRTLRVLKAEGDAHTNPGKTANPYLPAWIQTLVRKVSCFLKMLKLQREIKTVLPCWIKSVFPEMFHGLVEVKGWDS